MQRDECEKSTEISHSVGVENIFAALLSASAHTSHSAADVVVTYMPDAQREHQDVVSAGCPQQRRGV